MQSKKIKVLFENESVLVIDKPAGVSVFGSDFKPEEHKGENSVDKYLYDLQIKNNKKIKLGKVKSLLEPVNYFVVHRLDKDTTGCLLVAKNKSAYENLKLQFQNKQVRKEYLAVVWGHLKFDTGIVNSAIARSKSDFRKYEAVKTTIFGKATRGTEREAVTRYKVMKRVEKFGEKFTVVKFYPETCRTHQIRVHAKSLGRPIVADHLYGPGGEKFLKLEMKIFNIPPSPLSKGGTSAKHIRHLLHAEGISFTDPETGKSIKVESKQPKEFKF